MEAFLFGVNTVLPIFLLILSGYFLKKINLLNEAFISAGTSLVYYCALPVRVFQDVAKSDFHSMTNQNFILLIVVITVLAFVGIWLLAIKLCPEKSKRSAFVHSAFRGNYVYVGVPLTLSILGMSEIPETILVITFVIPLYNILGVLVLSYYDQGIGQISIRKLLWDILKNPVILAVITGLPFSFFQWKLPVPVEEAMNSFGSLATPLALLFVGAAIQYQAFIKTLRLSLKAAIVKVVIEPLIFVPLVVSLGFSAEEIVTVYVMLATPTALNAYIITRKLGGDSEVAAGIIMATTLISVVTIPIGIMILRGNGIIG